MKNILHQRASRSLCIALGRDQTHTVSQISIVNRRCWCTVLPLAIKIDDVGWRRRHRSIDQSSLYSSFEARDGSELRCVDPSCISSYLDRNHLATRISIAWLVPSCILSYLDRGPIWRDRSELHCVDPSCILSCLRTGVTVDTSGSSRGDAQDFQVPRRERATE
jgi:hypothetical protein